MAEMLARAGGRALAITTDVTDREQVKNLVDATVRTFGRVDVMITNAGLMPQAPENQDTLSTCRPWPGIGSDPSTPCGRCLKVCGRK